MRATLTCAGCGREAADPAARWCGGCGHPLVTAQPTAPARPEPVVAPVAWDDHGGAVAAGTGRAAFSARSRAVGAAVVLIVLGGLLAVQASRQAPAGPHGYTARGVPARTGVASVAAIDRPDRLAWQTAVELPLLTPPATAVHAGEDLVYVLDLDGQQGVTAHDATTGRVVWNRSDLALSEVDPVISGDIVVVGTRDGGRTAIGPDGRTLWVEHAGLGGPVAAGGGIADIQHRSRVTLRDAETARERWSVDLTDALDVSAQYILPQGPDDLVVVLTNQPPGLELGQNPEIETTHLVGIEARSGEIRWVIDLPPGLAWFQAPIAIDDAVAVAANVASVAFWDLDSGRLIDEHLRQIAFRPLEVAAADGAAILLDPLGMVTAVDADGSVRWTADTTLPATLDVRGDAVLVSTPERITLLDVATGAAVGGLPVDSESRRGPPAPDGTAFFLRRDGRLVAYEPGGGSRFERATVVPQAPPPAVADGTLYVTTGTGLSVLDADDGAPIWEHRSTDPSGSIAGELYTPVVDEDVVIVSPPRSQPLEVGGVYALQRDTGILAWQRLTDRPSPRGPLTFDRDIAVLPVEEDLHGHAPVGGRRALSATAYGARGPVAASGGLLVAATEPGGSSQLGGPTVIAIRRADRTRVWEEHVEACTPPSIADDLVVLGTDRGFRALDLATGTQRWDAVGSAVPVCGDLVVAADRAVGVAGGVTLRAAVLGSGAPAWDLDLPEAAAASPAVIGDEVLVPLVDGTLVAVALGDGTLRWTLELGGIPVSSPIVSDGRVILLLRDGRLVAYEPS